MSNPRYRQSPALRVESIGEAQAFVDDVGICTFHGDRGGLPTFYGAIAGRPGPTPSWGSDDREYDRAWSWKDKLFSQGRVYYGKALGDYRMLMSRRLLPYVCAACAPGPIGSDEDYLELYEDGRLTHDAKTLYDALRETGPASTTRLRKVSRIELRRFDRALAELQRTFLIAPVGIDRDNRWKYTFRYAPLHVAFPAETAAAIAMHSRAATSHVLLHYIQLVGETTAAAACRLFGWPSERVTRVVDSLVGDGLIAEERSRLTPLSPSSRSRARSTSASRRTARSPA